MNDRNQNAQVDVNGGQEEPKDLDFTEFEPSVPSAEPSKNLDFLLDIPLEIKVELGRTKIQIGELLRLSQGSVVALEKLTNEPVDVLINQKLMAHGEVVIVNEKFAVRLTNVISPGERVQKLG